MSDVPTHDAPLETLSTSLSERLERDGYLLAPAGEIAPVFHDWCAAHEHRTRDHDALARYWNDLAPDRFMGDGGRYRRRRHAVFSAASGASALVRKPHQAHFQTTDFNRLNGGIERHFEPVEGGVLATHTFAFLCELTLGVFGRCAPGVDWHVEMHQFRIEVGGDITAGLPTPEGLHRDGVDFVAMVMVGRHNVGEGVSHIHDLDRRELAAFTLAEPLDMALVDDTRVLHGVTPIVAKDASRPGHRDLLVLTFKRQPSDHVCGGVSDV
ncbi:2OG-Fe dioxygenase family protein [Kushneria sp. Sum13]|uniref:2OG-Fe dioxygenase family protein n=1 Tax=Kushneria sp. Sum13 TaxID=3459196 RepID=UPI004046000A